MNDDRQQDQWMCTTFLLGIYGKARTLEQLTQASKRMVASGVDIQALGGVPHALTTMSTHERTLWDEMNSRGFAIEQMLAFAAAPREATSFGQITRPQIMSNVMRDWKSVPQAALQNSLDRSSAVGSLVMIAGVVACTTLYAYGLGAEDPAIQETAIITASVFPDAVSSMLKQVTGTLVGLGAVGLGGTLIAGKMGKALANRREDITKAKLVALDAALSCQVEPGSVVEPLKDFAKTKFFMSEIPRPMHNLLSHLDGNELRLFLHGNDALRKEILTARPPSYSQRLACIQASDNTMFRKWIEELKLAGSSWNGPLIAGETGLKDSLEAMRNRERSHLTLPESGLLRMV